MYCKIEFFSFSNGDLVDYLNKFKYISFEKLEDFAEYSVKHMGVIVCVTLLDGDNEGIEYWYHPVNIEK